MKGPSRRVFLNRLAWSHFFEWDKKLERIDETKRGIQNLWKRLGQTADLLE